MAYKIRVKLKGFDYRLIDRSAKEIVETARRSSSKIAGVVPLPTKVERFIVLKSPHVNKKAREQFEIRTHKRLIEILEPTEETIESLTHLQLPAGVRADIKVYMDEGEV